MVAIENATVPATVFGQSNTDLFGARSLGRFGVPVCVVGFDPEKRVLFSRYCRWTILCKSPLFTGQSVRELLGVGARLGRKSVLMASSDQGAVFMSEHADELGERFIFPRQNSKLIRSLTNKKEMYALARKFDIPTPDSVFPQDRQDLLTNPIPSFPIMLKQIRTWLPPSSKVIVDTKDELLKNYDLMENPREPNLMLQEFVPGEDDTAWFFHGYFNENSECLFGLTAKKMRQWPAYHGETSLGVCLPNPTLERIAKKFMEAIDYRGIVGLDFRQDQRNGQYKVLDVNPRLSRNFRVLVTDNGMDIARAFYLDMIGQPVTTGTPVEGRKWVSEDLETPASRRYHADGNLPLKRWVKSYLGVRETAIFAIDDPLPFLKPIGHRFRKRLALL
ncbi:MAG: hypothetical protein ACHQ03_09120 [Candidatus Bathyarchaeia archaeon]